MQGDTRPRGTGDALDWHQAAEWLRWYLANVNVAGLRLDAPLEVRQPQMHDPQHDIVIRLGGADLALHVADDAAPDTTRTLARTADWLTVLHPHFTLAPRVFAVCTDPAVLGRAFFVTEHRRGVAVTTREPMALHAEPDRRQALGFALVDALADLHRLDGEAEPFAPFRAEPGAIDRALQQWLDLWTPLRGQYPDLDSIALWLTAYEPAESLEPTAVHGAFGLSALRLDPLEPARIVAVLDWEHAAVGDPLSDLGTLLASWVAVDADEPHSTGLVTAGTGYPPSGTLAVHYGERTGRSLEALPFHEVFGLFRRTVALAGTPESPRQHAAVAHLAAVARARSTQS